MQCEGFSCGGFSCCGAWALGARASVVVARGLSSCGSRALECRLSSCGTRAYVALRHVGSSGPGLESVSPALAGGFLTTAPPGKPWTFHINGDSLWFFITTMFVCCRVPLEPIKVRFQMGATSYHLKKIFPGQPEASPSQELFGWGPRCC